MKKVPIVITFLFCLWLGTACGHKKDVELMPEMMLAEKIMYEYPDSALHLLQKMKRPSTHDKWQYANWCLLKTHAEFKCYIDSIPEEQLNTGVDYFIKRDNHQRKALAYYIKAQIDREQGKIGEYEHLHALLKSAKEAELSDDDLLNCLIYNNIILKYLFRHKTDKALHYINKARIHAERSGNKSHQTLVQQYFGRAYSLIGEQTKNYSQSIQHYLEGIQIAKASKDDNMHAQLLGELAMIYSRNHEYDLSLKCAKEALVIEKKTQKNPIYLSLADAYYSIGNMDSAIYYLKKDLANPNIYTRASCNLGLYLIYNSHLKDYKKALEYYTIHNALEDSIHIIQENEKIAKMEEEDAKIKALDERNQMKMERDESRQLWILSVCISIALIAYLIYRYKRKIRKKEEMLHRYTLQLHENENIIARNKQFAAQLQEQIAHAHETDESSEEQRRALTALQQLNEKLRAENLRMQQHIDSYKHLPQKQELEMLKANAERVLYLEERERQLTEELANTNELVRSLRENPKFLKEPEWEQLRLVTNKIYNHFTERLVSQFPQLTEVDMQLCILVKLRFTVSQIAILTAVSPATVSVQKQRLKKRILQTDENPMAKRKTIDMWVWEY